jgi:hypothetical protein
MFDHSFDAIYSRKNCHPDEIANRCSWRSRSRVNCDQHPHCYSEIGDGHPAIASNETGFARVIYISHCPLHKKCGKCRLPLAIFSVNILLKPEGYTCQLYGGLRCAMEARAE